METKEEKQIDLKQLALDISENKVFTNWYHMRREEAHLISSVFLPFAFLSKEAMQGIKDRHIALLYEYNDKSLNSSINGYPVFGSVQMLDRVQLEELDRHLIEIDGWKEKWKTT